MSVKPSDIIKIVLKSITTVIYDIVDRNTANVTALGMLWALLRLPKNGTLEEDRLLTGEGVYFLVDANHVVAAALQLMECFNFLRLSPTSQYY